jgi:hypothetical protein
MKSLKQLSEMNQEATARRYPNVPDHALPKKKFTDTTANGLTKAIIEWLTLNGCWATRISSAGRYIASEGKFIPSTTKKGTADIHAVIAGRHVSIEVKIGKDRMSEAQKKVKQDVERSGGLYFVANDFDSFIKWFKVITEITVSEISNPKN